MSNTPPFSNGPAQSRVDFVPSGVGSVLPQNIDLLAAARAIWMRKWLVLLFGLLGLGLAQLYISQYPIKYRASVNILLNEKMTNLGDYQLVFDRRRTARDQLIRETLVIKSDKVLTRVAQKIDLENYADFNPSLVKTPLVQKIAQAVVSLPGKALRLFRGDDGVIVDGAPGQSAASTTLTAEEVEQHRLRKYARRIAAGVSVDSPQQSSTLLIISYTSSDRNLSMQMANLIANEYLNEQLEAKFEATERASAWLMERLETLRQQVESAESAVVTYKSAQTASIGQSEELLKEQLTQLNGQLINARAEVTAIQIKMRQASLLSGAGNMDALADYLNTEEILTARSQVKALQRREVEMSTRYGNRHPKMVSIRAEIADAQSQYESQIRKGVQTIQNELNIAKAKEDTVKSALKELELVSNKSGRASIKQRQFEREAQASRMVYQNFLERFNQTSGQEGITESDGRIISEARNAATVAPNRLYIWASGLVLGLALGVGLASLIAFFEPGFRTLRDLEEATGLPVLGQIPSTGPEDNSQEDYEIVSALVDTPNSSLAESLRALRVAIARTNIDNPPKVILTTSSVPQEGKSATSALLAMTCVQFGQKVILVDTDLRRPSVHKATNVDAKYNLIDVLEGDATVDEAIVTDPRTGLDVLVGKNIESNANAVVASAAFAKLVADLRERYDVVMLDAPPVIAVSDALLAAENADAVLFTVKWGDTPTDIVRTGLKILSDASTPVAGIVFQRIDMRKQARYGYGEYGYYYGRYGDYYGDNKKS